MKWKLWTLQVLPEENSAGKDGKYVRGVFIAVDQICPCQPMNNLLYAL